MEAFTCPRCHGCYAVSDMDAAIDEDDGMVTCPRCLRCFDPYATQGRAAAGGVSDGTQLADLMGSDEAGERGREDDD